jgi:hypothetical protein
VRNAAGESFRDAEVEVRWERDGTLLRRIRETRNPAGLYMVLDDAVPGLVRSGTAFLVRASRAGSTASTRLVVGPDARGCHIHLEEGTRVLVLR